MIVRRTIGNTKVVGGGGAIEMELSRFLRSYSREISGKPQVVIGYYARALEVIPKMLAQNSGADSTDILNKLRTAHMQADSKGRWYGVDCVNCEVIDTFANFIWEPVIVKDNALSAATEAACLILSIDETIKNPRSEQPKGGGKGKGKGKNPMGGMMGGMP